jgi:hypothetical protein
MATGDKWVQTLKPLTAMLASLDLFRRLDNYRGAGRGERLDFHHLLDKVGVDLAF